MLEILVAIKLSRKREKSDDCYSHAHLARRKNIRIELPHINEGMTQMLQ